MGQGTESCGGYDQEYDEYEEGLNKGIWTMKDGGTIHISRMSENHLRNTIRFCKSKSLNASFSYEVEKWDTWVDILEQELYSRKPKPTTPKSVNLSAATKSYKPVGLLVDMVCHCGKEYKARAADLKRGWGYSCSKSCAALRKTYNKPRARMKKYGEQ